VKISIRATCLLKKATCKIILRFFFVPSKRVINPRIIIVADGRRGTENKEVSTSCAKRPSGIMLRNRNVCNTICGPSMSLKCFFVAVKEAKSGEMAASKPTFKMIMLLYMRANIVPIRP
jgi:hypothetical protein